MASPRQGILRLEHVAVFVNWRLLVDVLAIGCLIGAAFAIDGDLLSMGDYPIGEWGEWLGHAHRVQLMREHGLVTWDHAWTGGTSPFQSYQFVPHAITAILANLAGMSTGRTMLFLEALLIFWVRSSGYVSARLIGLSPIACLIAGVMTFGLFDYSAEVLTFTTLWGLAVTPLLLVGSWRYRDGPAIYAVAAVGGLAVFVHPHAAVAGAVALLSGTMVGPVTALRVRRLALQGVIFGLATGFYWVPALLSAKPMMQDPTSADVDFLRRIFEANVDRINDLSWLVLPGIAVVTFFGWRVVRHDLFAYLATFFAIVMFLVAISYAGIGTETMRLMQSVRLVNLFPLALALFGAIAADACLQYMRQIEAKSLVGPAIAIGLAAALFAPSAAFARDRHYEPAWYGPDELGDWFEEHDYGQPGMIWMDGELTPWYTLKDFGELRSARSAFVQGDWSLLARPAQEGVLVGAPEWGTTEDYLRAMGVSYVLVADHTAAGRLLRSDDSDAGAYERVLRFDTFPPLTLYKAPWTPVVAFVSEADALPTLDYPQTTYASDSDRQRRDELTGEYAAFAYSEEATPLKVEYPSPTEMHISVDEIGNNQNLIVAENWDRSWKAETADGIGLRVERYGPNYILVDLTGLSGDAEIDLRHEMSYDWKLGLVVTLLSIPVSGGLVFWERRRRVEG